MEFLSQQGIPYVEKDVSRDRAAATEMIRRSGQRGVPVVTYGDEVIVGFDRPRLTRIVESVKSDAGGDARSAQLGLAVADAAAILAKLGRPTEYGAYVGKVKAGSAAERAGLRSGDVITRIDGRPVSDAADVERIRGELRPGSSVEVAYARDGTPMRADLRV